MFWMGQRIGAYCLRYSRKHKPILWMQHVRKESCIKSNVSMLSKISEVGYK